MIYVIRLDDGDLVKIGFTKSEKTLRVRILSLKTGCPLPLKVEATMHGSKLKERCLHAFCKNRHFDGEWFLLSKSEVQRMVQKYAKWNPTDHGIKTAPTIFHMKRQNIVPDFIG